MMYQAVAILKYGGNVSKEMTMNGRLLLTIDLVHVIMVVLFAEVWIKKKQPYMIIKLRALQKCEAFLLPKSVKYC